MKINEFFEKEYLVAGNACDNFIFENCPRNFLYYAKSKLMQSSGDVKSCIVVLDKEQERNLEVIFGYCNDFQKKILVRDYVVAVIMKELLDNNPEDMVFGFVCEQIKAFMNNDFDTVKSMHSESFMPYHITRFAKTIGKIELSFILEDIQNQYLQQAINMFVSSREPYSVKIFTNNKSLATYYDLNGNLIECPHDFMRRDVNKFIETEIQETGE